MWNDIVDNETKENLLKEINYFHDSCIKEIKYLSGAFVDENGAMYPVNDKRILSVIIQSQYNKNLSLEMEFSQLRFLVLGPVNEDYTCEIHDAYLWMKDGYLYWSDNTSLSNNVPLELLDYEGILICAKKLRWRYIS